MSGFSRIVSIISIMKNRRSGSAVLFVLIYISLILIFAFIFTFAIPSHFVVSGPTEDFIFLESLRDSATKVCLEFNGKRVEDTGWAETTGLATFSCAFFKLPRFEQDANYKGNKYIFNSASFSNISFLIDSDRKKVFQFTLTLTLVPRSAKYAEYLSIPAKLYIERDRDVSRTRMGDLIAVEGTDEVREIANIFFVGMKEASLRKKELYFFDPDIFEEVDYLSDAIPRKGNFFRMLQFSVSNATTVGFSEVKPRGGWAVLFICLESVLGIVLLGFVASHSYELITRNSTNAKCYDS